jgi:endonuclease YncB( thermonuclease family)
LSFALRRLGQLLQSRNISITQVLCSLPRAFAPAIVPLLLAASFAFAAPPGWEVLENCRLASSEYADGDSFHVIHNGKDHHFRLYFVDCPETDDRFPARLEDQAKALGIQLSEVMTVGKKAGEFSAALLQQPFTVLTKWEDARGASKSQRFYAVILVGNKNLAEELTKNGLARAYGMPADYPSAAQTQSFQRRLKGLQASAINSRKGGYALSKGFVKADEPPASPQEYIDYESKLSDDILQEGLGGLLTQPEPF